MAVQPGMLCQRPFSCMAVLVSDIQPMLKKIFRNFQKWMLSPQSTKVPLGSTEDFNIFDNILE